jgi:hypothetical protein
MPGRRDRPAIGGKERLEALSLALGPGQQSEAGLTTTSSEPREGVQFNGGTDYPPFNLAPFPTQAL